MKGKSNAHKNIKRKKAYKNLFKSSSFQSLADAFRTLKVSIAIQKILETHKALRMNLEITLFRYSCRLLLIFLLYFQGFTFYVPKMYEHVVMFTHYIFAVIIYSLILNSPQKFLLKKTHLSLHIFTFYWFSHDAIHKPTYPCKFTSSNMLMFAKMKSLICN